MGKLLDATGESSLNIDSTHPTDNGYKKMAAVWYRKLPRSPTLPQFVTYISQRVLNEHLNMDGLASLPKV